MSDQKPLRFGLKRRQLRTLAQRQRDAVRPRQPSIATANGALSHSWEDDETPDREEAAARAMLQRLEARLRESSSSTSKLASPSNGGGTNGRLAAAAPRRGECLRLTLLPTHLLIEDVDLALPYSAETNRFLRCVEAGRLPLLQLRSNPALWALCEKRFIEGCLPVEVSDRRSPEAEAEAAARRATGGGESGTTLACLTEAALLLATAPPPCLRAAEAGPAAAAPLGVIGRLANALQFDRLKLHAYPQAGSPSPTAEEDRGGASSRMNANVCFPLLSRLSAIQAQQNHRVAESLPQATETLNRLILERRSEHSKRAQTLNHALFVKTAADQARRRAAEAATPLSASQVMQAAPPAIKRQRSGKAKEEPLSYTEELAVRCTEGPKQRGARIMGKSFLFS
ncbi:hypothetical protein EMIHUDRAFT_241329 [Emiliania huxleyi CCMP1516]|uniref:Uncharacterized protein n=2 Tax=Emiliania huxleyi TaxID=2903 RepID=A0A0D3JCX1_EMIH1|nr:hypothetical protein EMIHUDRAFT_241329 [Emiliania huxleyi CCMP1516]EOD21356.1 hypothetical protein EMIHUDRAFT_241329 [Emiliania huxleyi CCMP1516]|eukprot:XP_005773785.1 hypothetical protein EMIHUDRAFT_241329 [Emiliania huxleyi CCMP1516]